MGNFVTFEQSGIKYGALNIPEGYTKFWLEHNNLLCGNSTGFEEIKLAPTPITDNQLLESFEVKSVIIGLLSEITEDQALEMCDVTHIGQWRDYQYAKTSFDPCNEYQECFLSALESLHSRLTSLKLDTTKPILLLKINL